MIYSFLFIPIFNNFIFKGFEFKNREFGAALTGIKKNIKAAGKGDTTHFKPLPLEVENAIHTLLGKVLQIMKHRRDGNPTSYENALKEIPYEYKHSYHELIVIGAQYTITKFEIRRGQEGIEMLTKGHFKIIEKDGLKCFTRVRK